MIANVEVLLVISAETLDEADALAEDIVSRVKSGYQAQHALKSPASAGIHNAVLADASVESVAEKKRRAA